jgi:hypothetical protein
VETVLIERVLLLNLSISEIVSHHYSCLVEASSGIVSLLLSCIGVTFAEPQNPFSSIVYPGGHNIDRDSDKDALIF